MTEVNSSKVVIVGAGSAGISIASRLLRKAPYLKNQITLIDPAEVHYYQPLWTLVGGGQSQLADSRRTQASVMPHDVTWIKEAVQAFHPDENCVITDKGTTLQYEYLVVAAGIEIKWNQVKGLREALTTDGVSTNYSADSVEDTWKNIQNFRGGNAIFTQPSTPIKCGGAPQKIMYLADDAFAKAGIKDKTTIQFYSGTGSIFAVPRYAKTLEQVITRKAIKASYLMDLVEIDGEQKTATFQHIETGDQTTESYDMIHVTPPMGAPAFIASSSLANSDGWVDVDPYTLQHTSYTNIFSAGDCASLPTSKTGAAIRQQAPVAANNLLAAMNEQPLQHKYNGYTSCPLVTGVNRLIMAEFTYDNIPAETFPIDQSKERMSMYLVKKNLLPIMYWNGMLKGTM